MVWPNTESLLVTEHPPFTNFGQWVYRKLLQYESVIKETHNEFIAKSVIAQNR